MHKLKIFVLLLFATLWLGSTASGAIIVGRLNHVEGQIYRYMDADQSWNETFPDSPAGTLDMLATGADSKAEMQFPNGMLVRLAERTQIEITELRESYGLFRQQNGLARFYNYNDTGKLLVETARGTVEIRPGSAVDIRTTAEDVTVAAVHGQAIFQSDAGSSERQEVISGNSSLMFRIDSIVAGPGPIDRNWEKWCSGRDTVLAQNRRVHSEHLPETMQEYAYVLEPYGNWHRVYYRGYNYWAWQPRYVSAGWAPFTTGYWYDWQTEPVWIDDNPWGWVTHHHGHWLHLNGAWMWTPYIHVSNVAGVSIVGVTVQFGKQYRPYWHPGRVRWISDASHIGWLPLAPWEPYYGHRSWGPKSLIRSGKAGFNINISLAKHSYIDHAVIIPKRDFQRRRPVLKDHYNKVRVRNINKTVIVRNYRPDPPAEQYRAKNRLIRTTTAVRKTRAAAAQPLKRSAKRQEVHQPVNNNHRQPPATYNHKKTLKKTVTSVPQQTPPESFSRPTDNRSVSVGREKKSSAKTVRSVRQNRTTGHSKNLQSRAGAPKAQTRQDRKSQSGRTAEEVKVRAKLTRQAVIKERNRPGADRSTHVAEGRPNSRIQRQKQAGLKNRPLAGQTDRTGKTEDARAKFAAKGDNKGSTDVKEEQRGGRTRSTRGDNPRDRTSGSSFSVSAKNRMIR